MQRYLWQQAGGARHGYDTSRYRPLGNESFTALCGAEVTPRPDEVHNGELPQWFDPTCPDCNNRMLDLLAPRQTPRVPLRKMAAR